MREHKPRYSEAEEKYLVWYNKFVPLWLYVGLIIMVTVFSSFNLLSRAISSWHVQHYYSLHSRPPKASGLKERASRAYGSAILAAYRRFVYQPSKIVRLFGLESGAQAAVLVGYGILNLLIAGLGASGHPDYQAHHCARLFNSNLPLLVGLAAKELNFISWLTGFSYDTLNSFHRWVARLLLILATVHIGGRVYVNSPIINPSLPHMRYQAWGIVAYSLFAILILGSLRYVRVRWYTPFIVGHIFLFMLACICVGPGEAPGATVEILSEDCLRVSFKTVKKWAPGQHSYFHAPRLGAGGHPFTIASSSLPISHPPNAPPPLSSVQTFLVRVRGGFTRRLYQQALADSDLITKETEQSSFLQSVNIDAATVLGARKIPIFPAWIEGPHGQKLKPWRYEKAVFISGGSGISFSLPLVIWLWVVKDPTHIEWIKPDLIEILKYAPPNFLDIRFHITYSLSLSSVVSLGIDETVGRWDTRASASSGTTVGRQSEVEALASPAPASSRASFVDSTAPTSCDSHTGSMTPGTAVSHSSHSPLQQYQQSAGRDEDASSSSPAMPSLLSSTAPSADPSLSSLLDSNAQSSATETSKLTSELAVTPNEPGVVAESSTATPVLPPPMLGSVERGKWTAIVDGEAGKTLSVDLKYGRPNVKKLLEETVEGCGVADSIFVAACGPRGLTDRVGQAVSECIEPKKVLYGEHRRNITLHVEVFGW
ncbi:hypothetical protein T439DRAFT_356298 [Meredithblackwellia eburnea MCA 4105]